MKQKVSPVLVALTLVAGGVAAAGLDQPGDTHLIWPQDLPQPFITSSASNGPRLVDRPAGAQLLVPPGFRVELFYDGRLGDANSPRLMALAPNGDVFAAASGADTIYVLRDADRDGKAESLYIFASVPGPPRRHLLDPPERPRDPHAARYVWPPAFGRPAHRPDALAIPDHVPRTTCFRTRARRWAIARDGWRMVPCFLPEEEA
jgi:hypothetical protein